MSLKPFNTMLLYDMSSCICNKTNVSKIFELILLHEILGLSVTNPDLSVLLLFYSFNYKQKASCIVFLVIFVNYIVKR